MVDFPITINPATLSDFDYSADTLGLTPVVNSSTQLKIPMYTSHYSYLPTTGTSTPDEYATLMTESYMGGDFDTIWIGKDASVTFAFGYTDGTARHEIRSMAFEDGRTNLFENIRCGQIQDTYIWVESDQDYSFGTGSAHYFVPYQAGDGSWYDDLTKPVYGTTTEVLDPEGWWIDFETDPIPFVITDELRLPEGLTTFKEFMFGHPTSDPAYELYAPDPSRYPEPRLRHRHDINIYLPSTLTTFAIYGMSYIEGTLPSNLLYFGYDIGYPLMFSLLSESGEQIQQAGFNSIPERPDRDDYQTDEAYETALAAYEEEAQSFLDMCDHIHIYLKNHTSVPTITFLDNMTCPIVFHVNPEIYDDFVETYAGTQHYADDSSNPRLAGFDPITVVRTEVYGVEETETSTPLSETVFKSVAVTGSFNAFAARSKTRL